MNRKRVILVLAILAVFFLLPFSGIAQYQKLHDFGALPNGFTPYAAPVTDGTFLYGTTHDGGNFGYGVIYKVRQDGTGFSVLKHFDGSDGSEPYAGLLYDGSFLYGTTTTGGNFNNGVVFKIRTDGSAFSKLIDFQYGPTGSAPVSALITDGTYLYGTTAGGTPGGWGGLFKIRTDGSAFSVIVSFNGAGNGATPYASPIFDGTFLYGTTFGGFSFPGTVFKVQPDGSGFTTLHNMTNAINDGDKPFAGLYSDGTFLYGTTTTGGSNNLGTLFRIGTDGTGFFKLVNFNSTTGSTPRGALVSDGTFLYGTTSDDGVTNFGTIFKIKPDGSGFLKLGDMLTGTGGPYPEGTLLLQGSVLFGTRSGYGSGFVNQFPGHIFKINTDGTGLASVYNFKQEGKWPAASTIIEGAFHYGVAQNGGEYNAGVIFKIRADGTGYSDILSFKGDMGRPTGDLFSDGTWLYGVTESGGVNDVGTMYKVMPDGTGYTRLLDFDPPATGSIPHGGLISDGTFLYGATSSGGSHDSGTIYKIKPDGTGFVNLRDLDYNEGAGVYGKLLYESPFLYVATSAGGTLGAGTVFRMNTDGTSFLKLIDLDYNTMVAGPLGSLVSDGINLYVMGSGGTSSGLGGIIKIRADGTPGFTQLLSFDGTNGSNPIGTLLYDGSFLYGITSTGGLAGHGVVFRIKTDGTGFSRIFDLSDGYQAMGSLSTDGTSLYALTQYGGDHDSGTYIKVSKTLFVSITDFTPERGSAGTYVTITGNEFNPILSGNVVRFNGVTAELISTSANTIVAVVPDGATEGPITVTNGTTGTSATDFVVTLGAAMFDGGTVKNCNVDFISDDVSDDMIETFLPSNPADKVQISFSDFDMFDRFLIYDGMDDTSPVLADLQQFSVPGVYTATNAKGALTFKFIWQDNAESEWTAHITCVTSGGPVITITKQPADFSTCNGQVVTFSTAASGTTNLTYQWQVAPTLSGVYSNLNNTSVYGGTTSANLTVTTTGNLGEGFYKCLIGGDAASSVLTNAARLTFKTTGCDPVITTASSSGETGSILSINLIPLISTFGNNLNVSSISVVSGPPSGAVATITNGVLSINYNGVRLNGTEQVTIRACDTFSNCSTQTFSFTIHGNLVIYNAISPNGDKKNDTWYIENIDVLADTKENHVTIYDRWGDAVFEADNYDNTRVVFDGQGKQGNLTSGIFFYKITFSSGRPTLNGFLELRR